MQALNMNATLEFTAVDPNQRTNYILERATETLGLVASPGLFQPEMPLLFLHRLMKRYGETIAVNELSLTLEHGEIFGFLGPNGATKTTTIRVLCGLNRPNAGHGTILGYDIWRDRIQVRRLLGYVPQQFSLYPDLTVLGNLWFFASAYRVPLRKARKANCRIQTLLSELDLFGLRRRRAGQLSGGFKLELLGQKGEVMLRARRDSGTCLPFPLISQLYSVAVISYPNHNSQFSLCPNPRILQNPPPSANRSSAGERIRRSTRQRGWP